jgi:hypothetical protein
MSNPNPTPPTIEELRRLSLVRHLFGLGVSQSHGSEPTAGLSILPFHDAAEAFLQLASERYQAGENKADFMQYWALLAAKSIEVPERETMRRLNAARRGLKHQGILPAHIELEGFRAAVTNFLYGSTPILFGIDFDKISQVHLILDTAAREKLEEAYAALATNDHLTTLGSVAVAFILVQRAHNQTLALMFPPHTPASLRQRASRSVFSNFAVRNIETTFGNELARSIQQINESSSRSIDVLSEAIEIIGYGLDFRDYMLFKSHIPVVHQIIDGSMTIDWIREPTPDAEVVRKCVDFVVDVAVRLHV